MTPRTIPESGSAAGLPPAHAPERERAGEAGKVFVTGVYGSGKTRFAKAYARRRGLPYFEFDLLHDYRKRDKQSGKILDGLPGSFVIDAIPIDENDGWDDFAAYEARNDVLVVCVYCPDRARWLRRIQEKEYRNDPRQGGRAALRLLYRIGRLRLRPRYPLSIDTALHLRAYRFFFSRNAPYLSRFRRVLYYDSSRGEYTTADVMLRRVRFRTFPLEDRLDALGKDHDWKYQDIEILDFKGYSQSDETWKRIRGLVDWKGKRVLDLGCFHGYFCFKAEDAGAEATGLDRSPSVLAIARAINDLRGGRAVFREWEGGDDLPAGDVVLCLNVLHHFADQDKAVSRMRCREAVFEINAACRSAVEKHFEVVREVSSHRKDRVILLCARRGAEDGRREERPLPKFALLSHVLPPFPSGQSIVIDRLLRGLPPDRYCLLTRGECPPSGPDGDKAGWLPGRHYGLTPAARIFGERFLRPETLAEGAKAAVRIVRRAREIARVLRAERCALLVACTGDPYDLPAASLAGRWARVPVVPYLFDDYAFQWTGPLRAISRRIEPAVVRRARGIIVPNEFMRREYERRHGVSGAVIRNPCPLPDLAALDRAAPAFDPDEKSIVFAGAVYHANHDAFRNLLEAIRKLGDPRVRLHLFTARTESLLSEAGIAGPEVVRHSPVPAAAVPGVLRRAGLLFLPLSFDGPIPEVIRTSAPGKTAEYLSVGRPVLVHAPADSFVSWYFRENGCGLVADRNDPEALAAAVARLFSDAELRSELSGRARRCAERDFDVERIRGQFAELLSSLAGGSGKAAGR